MYTCENPTRLKFENFKKMFYIQDKQALIMLASSIILDPRPPRSTFADSSSDSEPLAKPIPIRRNRPRKTRSDHRPGIIDGVDYSSLPR